MAMRPAHVSLEIPIYSVPFIAHASITYPSLVAHTLLGPALFCSRHRSTRRTTHIFSSRRRQPLSPHIYTQTLSQQCPPAAYHHLKTVPRAHRSSLCHHYRTRSHRYRKRGASATSHCTQTHTLHIRRIAKPRYVSARFIPCASTGSNVSRIYSLA